MGSLGPQADGQPEHERFYYVARIRPRRFHCRVTHVLVSCEFDEGTCLKRGSYSLKQRRDKLWEFLTPWAIARDFASYTKICFASVDHTNGDRGTFTLAAHYDDPKLVWPGKLKQERAPRDPDAAPRPRRQGRAKKSGGLSYKRPHATTLVKPFVPVEVPEVPAAVPPPPPVPPAPPLPPQPAVVQPAGGKGGKGAGKGTSSTSSSSSSSSGSGSTSSSDSDEVSPCIACDVLPVFAK